MESMALPAISFELQEPAMTITLVSLFQQISHTSLLVKSVPD